MNMDDKEILEDFVTSRNLSYKTIVSYKSAIRIYKKYTGLTLSELITEAEEEEDKGIRWKKRKLKSRLLGFRTYLQEQYLTSTAKLHFGRIQTIYKHYEIEIHDLPPLSQKNVKQSTPINYADLPDKEIIKKSIKIATPVMKSLILFMTSSGCAKNEALSLTIDDFIKATQEYHDETNIYDIIHLLISRNDIVPTFRLKRKKTNKYYTTFCSPEATNQILNYLLVRKEDLKNEDKLLKIGNTYLTESFVEINNTLKLGKVGSFNRFRSHMLRKFHASQLYNDGMSMDDVDALQGRGKDKTHNSYFMENPQKLKEKYIEHMDSITINFDVENLTYKSPEYLELQRKYDEKATEVENISSKIRKIEDSFADLEKLKNKLKLD